MGNNKMVKICLSVPEIVYDIQNKTYIAGRTREGEGENNYESAFNMQVSDEDETVYQIRRSLTTVLTSLKSRLGEYLVAIKKPLGNTIAEEVDANGEIALMFRLPDNFNEASSDALSEGIHSYLVDMVIGDWFIVTNKGDAKDYIERAGAGLKIVERALFKRSRPQRPNYMPYD